MKESVLSFEKDNTTFQIAGKYKHSFKTNPLNIILDDFSICLLEYRTEISCLCIPQVHNFIVQCGFEVQMNTYLLIFDFDLRPSLSEVAWH